ncbi:hypothetical protein [Desulforhopalus singaporensis]|uniref:Uncharacterized protein n=1 Tax=Desulforhopalus singaporensis TaxID=91360 RepID=A0A1H0R2W5_9BACT|nr:hypothetical protein [Desulforhopalus singaporensis]SDP23406.1 hypothetical protein SAMN05660330_02174 [Desulforhopalus singaporensis]
MFVKKNIIKQAARTTGTNEEDLAIFLAESKQRTYEPNEWLFHESTPRQ